MVSLEALRTPFNVVDSSILQQLYQPRIDVSDANRRSRSLALAAHVFMYVTLRQVPARSPLLQQICATLQSTVGLAPFAIDIWTESRAALLWIAFVGLLGTRKGKETGPRGQWFLSLFRSIEQEHHQSFPLDNGGVRKILSTFLWDETYCEPLLSGLEECQGCALVQLS